MKALLFLPLCLVIAPSLSAESLWIEKPGQPAYAEHIPVVRIPLIRLADGREFRDCQVFSETYLTISFRHAKGLTKLEKSRLPADLLKQFPIHAEKAQAEIAANAEGRKAYADKIAQRENKALVKADRAEERSVVPVPRPPAAKPAVPSAALAAVRRHAEKYFRDGRKNGSGQTLVFNLQIDLEEPREVPGWTGRYEVKGEAAYSYYESIKGGAFSSASRSFTCQVENGRVVDFSPGF